MNFEIYRHRPVLILDKTTYEVNKECLEKHHTDEQSDSTTARLWILKEIREKDRYY